MIERMVAHSVTAFKYHAVNIRMLTHIVADAKECGFNLVTVEQVKHPWRNLGNRTVVKCQVDTFLLPG